MHFPDDDAPPVIDRLLQPSERALRDEWPHLERQLDAAVIYLKELERSGRPSLKGDEGFRWLQRSIRELDQYARAIRWVLTVSESETER